MALKTIQVVLEGLLLRREKSMKDRDGNPIVPLPKKKFIMVRSACLSDLHPLTVCVQEELDLSKEERAIYDKVSIMVFTPGRDPLKHTLQVYEDAKTRYLTFAENGTVKSNTIAILAIITRLRQACLHPSLLLKAGTQDDPSRQLVRRMVGKWVAKHTSADNEEEVLAELNEDDDEVYQSVCMLCQSVSPICISLDQR